MSEAQKTAPDAAAPAGAETVARKNAFEEMDLGSIDLSMEQLLKAGVHFGHQKSRRNPKMSDFLFGARQNISIIDLEKTVPAAEEALKFLTEVKNSGKQILFVGTKKQARNLVIDAAEYTGNPYVVDRWLGGTFTNFGNIRKRVRYMTRLKEQIDKGELKKYTKFEQVKKGEECEKLEGRMGGITEMAELPGAIVITDLAADKLAVREAQKTGVPIVALADSNVNPSDADYPIPANDDAISSLQHMIGLIVKTLGKK